MGQDAPASQTRNKTDHDGVSRCHLDGLPAELLDTILFNIDAIRDLAHFIATARFVYHRFKTQKRAILFGVLQNELSTVLVDARFLLVFPYSNPGNWLEYLSCMHLKADLYRDMLRTGNMPARGDALPSLNELMQICRTLNQVNFVADMYIAARLRSFDLSGGRGTPATAPISPLERQRLVRAFYRRQILSNAWAATRRAHLWTTQDTEAISNSSTHRGERLGLFGTLKPWELQHIDHADAFLMRLCLALVHHSPRTADGAPGIPPRQFDDLFAHLHLLVQFLQTNHGVAELATGDLPAGREPAHCSRLRSEYENPYQMIPLRFAWQSSCAESHPDPVRDKWDQDGLAVPYVGEGLDLVPYGWVDALRGRYVKWFGEGLHSISWLPRWQSDQKSLVQFYAWILWREAGFSLWNPKRIEALKKLSLFGALHTGWVLDRLVERDD